MIRAPNQLAEIKIDWIRPIIIDELQSWFAEGMRGVRYLMLRQAEGPVIQRIKMHEGIAHREDMRDALREAGATWVVSLHFIEQPYGAAARSKFVEVMIAVESLDLGIWSSWAEVYLPIPNAENPEEAKPRVDIRWLVPTDGHRSRVAFWY